MKDILAKANVDVLAQFASSKVVVAFDYDGTLAPIVDEPEEARVPPRTRELLERLCRVYPCIVISGRGQGDVLERVRGLGVLEVIGNHGLEPWRRTEDFAEQVQKWMPTLQSGLGHIQGLKIEDKVFSVALHYRHCREKKAAKESILNVVAKLGPVRALGGELVINLLPDGAPHKGIALKAARDRVGCDTAIYVGDDETDEDVFSLDEPGRLLTVRIGERQDSAAAFFIRAQESIDPFLEVLLSLRPKEAGHLKVDAR